MPQSRYSSRYERLKSALVEKRKEAGLTQIDLAKALGRPQSFVSKYETGERRLDVVEFIEVCEAVGTSPERLIKSIS